MLLGSLGLKIAGLWICHGMWPFVAILVMFLNYPYLQIVAYLIPVLDDKFPLLRSITCWTLSRFSKFIVQVWTTYSSLCYWFENESPTPSLQSYTMLCFVWWHCKFFWFKNLIFPFQGMVNQKGTEQFNKVLMGLLRRILDTNKRVQEAACSAFATLEEVFDLFL